MYRIVMPVFNKPITPEVTHLDDSFLIMPFAKGDTVKNGRKMIPLIGRPDFDTTALPIFDYFHLETDDKDRRKWEWCKNDIHQIYGEYSPKTSLFISPRVRNILDKYSIAKPSGFVPAKLQYRGEKFDFYIFYCTIFSTFNDIAYNQSSFQILNDSKRNELIDNYQGKIETFDDWQLAYSEVSKKYQNTMFFKKAVIKKYYDFFMLYGDRFFYVSERLKKDLEDNGITGIEFIEATDMEFHFLETPSALE